MTTLHKQEEKSTNLMAGTWTKAAKVRRMFKAGRKRQKDRVLTPTKAIYEACILLDDLRNAMREAGLSADDVRAGLVLMTPEAPSGFDQVQALPIPQPKELPDLFAKVSRAEKAGLMLPLGIVIQQRDREGEDPKSLGATWVEPFLTGPRAVRALIEARRAFGDGQGGKSTFN
jgi:hypothetical protein